MSLGPTLIGAVLAAALAVLFGWLGARPARPMERPRLVPWRALMLAAFAVTLVFLVHLVALARGGH